MTLNALWVALGGAAGCVSRYAVSLWLAPWSQAALFPLGTLAVNVAGSLVLGVLTDLATREPRVSPAWVALLGTGFCGGFTTMSTFSTETLRLPLPSAALNVAANVGLCLLAAWVGMRLARFVG